MKFIQVTNLNSLYALQQHENGEVAYVQDIEKYYSWNGESWVQIDPGATNFGMSLYEMNKQIIAQTPTLSGAELEAARLILYAIVL